mmetsp:Transcript_34481/g.53838  ORF Transcript_34481/g.53838 Transcript_34481/m.53838 type:complete len:109 (-) Transcript_34481:208-534(-)
MQAASPSRICPSRDCQPSPSKLDRAEKRRKYLILISWQVAKLIINLEARHAGRKAGHPAGAAAAAPLHAAIPAHPPPALRRRALDQNPQSSKPQSSLASEQLAILEPA